MRLFSRKLTVQIRQMKEEDIEEVREVGKRAWSDLYSREFKQNFDVPKRSVRNIRFYLEKEPEGCLVAESRGRIVGDIFCHVWGSVGWFGPVEVHPSYQNMGVGKRLIMEGIESMERKGCTVIGLETMPETLKNVTLYSNIGCIPDRMTYLMERPVINRRLVQLEGVEILHYDDISRDAAESAVRELSACVMKGLDYSNEVRCSMKHRTGETLFMRKNGRIHGFSLIYTYSTSDGSTNASVRILVTSPEASGNAEVDMLLKASEQVAFEAGRDRIHVRFYTGNFRIFSMLRDNGYSLRGTNIRMLYRGEVPANHNICHINSWAG